MKQRTGKAYWRLYLSYVLIFCIPIIMGILFYIYTYQIVRTQADRTNSSLVRLLKNDCDKELKMYENVLTQLAMNSNIQELSVVKEGFGARDAYTLYALQNDLRTLMTSSNQYGDYFGDIFVYFKNCDKIVSVRGNMDLKMYHELYYSDMEQSLEEWESCLSQFHYRDLEKVKRKDINTPYLTMMMTNLRGDFGVSTANVGIVINMEGLIKVVEAASWESGVITLLLDSTNQVINEPRISIEGLELDYQSLVEGESQGITWNGEKFLAQVMNSDIADWKYVLLMPERLVSGSAGKVRNIFMIGIVVCLIVGVWAAFLMMKLNYNPLKSLLEVFQKLTVNDEEEYSNNEYTYLKNRADILLREHADYKQMVSRDKVVIKQYYLSQLLENSYTEIELKYKKNAVLTVSLFHEGKNIVLLFSFAEENSQETEKNSLSRFIIGNIFGEGIGELFTVETAELGEYVAMIINMKEEDEECDKRLREQVEFLQKLVQEKFGLQVLVAVGGWHEDLVGVHTSYIEAKEADEFISVLESDYITYEEIRNVEGKRYDYSVEKEEKLIAAIRARNEALAISYVNRVLDTNYIENKLPPYMLNCLVYDLLGTVMKGAEEAGRTKLLEEGQAFRNFSIKLSLPELKTRFANLLHELCSENAVGGVEDEQKNEFADKILDYIKAHYHDPDLNISQTGLHFHMTPAYLSSIFKKQTGESLLKVINGIRVEEAEKLLSEGISVVEVAERVGFREPSTFIRTFKKITGVTPGQFKGK